MVGLTAEGISEAIVADIYKNIDVITADRFLQDSFSFTGTKTRQFRFNQISVSFVTVKSNGVVMFGLAVFSPFYQILIYLFSQFSAAVR